MSIYSTYCVYRREYQGDLLNGYSFSAGVLPHNSGTSVGFIFRSSLRASVTVVQCIFHVSHCELQHLLAGRTLATAQFVSRNNKLSSRSQNVHYNAEFPK